MEETGAADADHIVTLRDVARHAGVDVSTASRALTGRRSVNASTAGRVHTAAAALGYSPNEAARSLRLSRTMTLGIVLQQLSGPGLLEFVEGLGSGAEEHGYSLMVTIARGDPQHYRTLVRRLFERRVDGLFVATPPELEDELRLFTRAGTQVMALFTRGACGEDLPLLMAYEDGATRLAMQRLQELGHRRALYLGVPPSIPSVRMDWLQAAAQQSGVELTARVVTREEPAAALEAWLRHEFAKPGRPTALFSEYGMAPRILGALRSLDLAAPADLSLVVFGESAWTMELGPPLASIRHDLRAMGRMAADVMVDRLLGRQTPNLVDAGVAEWVERASVGPVP